jgi:hypothetical protein
LKYRWALRANEQLLYVSLEDFSKGHSIQTAGFAVGTVGVVRYGQSIVNSNLSDPGVVRRETRPLAFRTCPYGTSRKRWVDDAFLRSD